MPAPAGALDVFSYVDQSVTLKMIKADTTQYGADIVIAGRVADAAPTIGAAA